MIKTLLNADEEPPPGTKVVVEETVINPPLAEAPTVEVNPSEETPAQISTIEENITENSTSPANFEIPEDAKFFNREAENVEQTAPVQAEETPLDEDSESLAALMSEIENLEPEEFDRLEAEITNAESGESAAATAETPAAPVIETRETAENAAPAVIETEKAVAQSPETETETVTKSLDSDWLGNSAMIEETVEKKSAAAAPVSTIFQSDYTPPTTAQTIRNSGLAWSAGVVFFGSVIFMMIFGWFADLLFGSSPWGLVGGIILGGVIGFIQFFRITSQIFKK